MSSLASDPDMAELVMMYVDEMPSRIESLGRLWNEHNLDELRRLAHQLKGASGGYGFEPVGEAAARLESELITGSKNQAESHADRIRSAFESLLELCRRVSR